MAKINLDREFSRQLPILQRAAAKDGSTVKVDNYRLIIYWIDPDGSADIAWSPDKAMAFSFDDGSYQ
jgi:hypothetical protein